MTHQINFFGFFLEVERSKSLNLFQIQNPSVASIIYPESTQKRKGHKKYTIQKGSTLQDKKLMNSKSESIYNQSQTQSRVRAQFKTQLAMKLDDTTVVFQEAEFTDYPFTNVIETQIQESQG